MQLQSVFSLFLRLYLLFMRAEGHALLPTKLATKLKSSQVFHQRSFDLLPRSSSSRNHDHHQRLIDRASCTTKPLNKAVTLTDTLSGLSVQKRWVSEVPVLSRGGLFVKTNFLLSCKRHRGDVTQDNRDSD